ncbi:MAG: TSUP family transporter [Streptosporangiales bacterium]|nr:TSUP family transporter [Streptosporangiales bacterium]
MDLTLIVVVAAIVAVASLLGGLSGFGYGLVAAPSLLAVGVPMPTIVLLNLGLGIITRGVALARLRRHVTRRATLLVAGSLPGYSVGALLLGRIDTEVLKVATGAIVIVLALVSLAMRKPAYQPAKGSFFFAGAAGGLLGATTSLNGVVPALVMTQARPPSREFIADLAAFFVGSSIFGLVAVLVGGISAPHGWLLLAISVPGSVAGNLIGTCAGTRLPAHVFRTIALFVVICAGVAAILA